MASYKILLKRTAYQLLIIGLVWGPLFALSHTLIGNYPFFPVYLVLAAWIYYLLFHGYVALLFIILFKAFSLVLAFKPNHVIPRLALSVALSFVFAFFFTWWDFVDRRYYNVAVLFVDFAILSLVFGFMDSRTQKQHQNLPGQESPETE